MMMSATFLGNTLSQKGKGAFHEEYSVYVKAFINNVECWDFRI